MRKINTNTFKTWLKEIHKLFLDKYVYRIMVCVLVLLVLLLNLNSFKSYKDYRNYTDDNNCYMTFCRTSSYTFSFEAKDDRLNNFRLYLNNNASHLMSSDRMTVLITDDEGEVLMNANCYLYNSNRSYVEIDCGDLNLSKNERYIVRLSFEDCSTETLVLFYAHSIGGFDSSRDYVLGSDKEDEMSFDLAIGFSKMLNINYRYSKVNLGYLFFNLLIYLSSVGLLFLFKLWKKDSFKEFYRAVYGTLYIFVIGEILNVENTTALNILFPLSIKHYFCLFIMLLLLVIFYYAIYMICGYGSLAMLITSLPFIVMAYVNSIKLVMRGDSFMPWDLISAGIAVKTGSTYYFHITKPFICGVLLTIAFYILIMLTRTPKYKASKQRFSLLAVCILSFAIVFERTVMDNSLLDSLKVYYEVYPPMQSYNENGTYLAFLLHLNNINGRSVEIDSREKMLSLEDKYAVEVAKQRLDYSVFNNSLKSVNSSGARVKPMVICIMSEAYTDLFNIRDFTTDVPVTPFMDEFEEDTIHGDLAVSIFGGGTCNTEFEFLTGYSMSSLLPGCSVYTFYVNNDTQEALPNIFSDNGYHTIALHSFDGDWWDRREKYPLLGFDEFYTRDDFDPLDTHYVRNYISDLSTFEKITDFYDESVAKEEPLFLFCVTMQNHADFSQHYDNMKYDIHIQDLMNEDGGEYVYAQNYLSLQRESDEALEYLIDHINNTDYPTIVCFFGDHLPTLDDGFYDTLLENDLGTISLEDSLPLYNTSYFIWANYDLYDTENLSFNSSVISPNFLGQTVLDYAGIISPYSRSVLRTLHEEVCALSAVAVYDSDGVPHVDSSSLSEKVISTIEDYSSVEYGLIYYNDESKTEN